jgi:hypothetical protein
MTDTIPAPQPLPSLPARVVGIITSPRATFERIVQTPKILGMLALMAILSGIGGSAFTFTATGQQAIVDFSAQQIERFAGQPPTDAQMAQITGRAPYQGYITLVSTLFVIPIILAVEAGLLYVGFNVLLGGTATFKQVYAVAAHAGVITLLGLALTVPMQFVRGVISLTGPANLGVLFPMLPEDSVLSSFLGLIDFFRIWWVITISIGLGVLYRRPTRGIALTLLSVYAVIALGIAFIFHGR